MPLSADLDAPTSVILVRNVLFIVTSFVHHIPDAIFLLEMGLDRLTLAATIPLRTVIS